MAWKQRSLLLSTRVRSSDSHPILYVPVCSCMFQAKQNRVDQTCLIMEKPHAVHCLNISLSCFRARTSAWKPACLRCRAQFPTDGESLAGHAYPLTIPYTYTASLLSVWVPSSPNLSTISRSLRMSYLYTKRSFIFRTCFEFELWIRLEEMNQLGYVNNATRSRNSLEIEFWNFRKQIECTNSFFTEHAW